ncbi:Dihydroxyacetone kinase 1 [Colletotrichum orbiculare MAFF 240422]|uniref:Dihydroxyacetone kinase 1 n=1 Tax=Colletotrichum orbiculare (strain 104-T / ATCC 96160 / CBS 514.97 / LARS 414 / MAFF 240422) TaxID=1213857 RepID=N4VDJ4_COLOR|nr:Dihydroxyacetone kinase 1 [Colletotrichum orbiculare MAFF 240422]
MSRHFYDEADTLVLDALEALTLTHGGLTFDKSKKTIWLTNNDSKTVSILSGGGAGHEPAHAGFVGSGMLTAAVSGSIFASPSVAQILSGISRVASPAGVLLIIKNYTGDVFHFHLAAEKAKASLGVPVEVLIVGDDVSVGRKKSGKVGRRGLAGTVLVHKILGAHKETGASLADVLELGRTVTENLVTVGASLEHVHIPGREAAAAESGDQVELGMGIHNEPGCQVLSPRPGLPELIDAMLAQLLDAGDPDRGYVDFSDAEDVVVLVNNLGGVSPLEFGGITAKVVKALASRGLKLARVISGTYMTSLNGPGFSITLLKATPEMVKYVDAGTDALGWAYAPHGETDDDPSSRVVESPETSHGAGDSQSGVELDVALFKTIVADATARLVEAEPQITAHDSQVGDGDCGVTLVRGARAVSKYAESPSVTADAVRTAIDLTNVIEDNMDGTSGAIYGIFFAALSSELRGADAGKLGLTSWTKVVVGALATLQQATPARQGDRTLLDALEPFVRTLEGGGSVERAVAEARKGVEATKGMRASLGRAVYVEESAWGKVPDPGAEGVLAILEAIEAATA